jgi:hypothetical protein
MIEEIEEKEGGNMLWGHHHYIWCKDMLIPLKHDILIESCL